MKKNFGKIVCLMMLVVTVGIMMVGCHRPTVPKNPTYPQTEGDFKLTISVKSKTLKKGKDIEVIAVFENLSGERHEITKGRSLIHFFIVNHSYYNNTVASPAIESVIEKDAVINDARSMGSKLKKGKYELVAYASFSTDEPNSYFIYSNTIILTVK